MLSESESTSIDASPQVEDSNKTIDFIFNSLEQPNIDTNKENSIEKFENQINQLDTENLNKLQHEIEIENELEKIAEIQELGQINQDNSNSVWPEPLNEKFDDQSSNWPEISAINPNRCLEWINVNRKLLIKTITWNLQAEPPPSIIEAQQKLFPLNKFHLYIIGSEECQNSIAYSVINTNKDKWVEYLEKCLGPQYEKIASQTLQAIHITLFAHTAVSSLLSDIQTVAVPTGLANTLGNKGGVSIYFTFGLTRFLVTNAHLAAHQNKVSVRNDNFNRINKETPLLIKKYIENSNNNSLKSVKTLNEFESVEVSTPTNEKIDMKNCSTEQPLSNIGLASSADRVIFMGDLNYRIRGNRKIVDTLLDLNMHDVLIENDQLKWAMKQGSVLKEFVEAPLNFRPTFKFDRGSDSYDTSSKQRVPSWTDRILYVPRGLQCIAYDSDMSLKTSDHRPVYASFFADIMIDSDKVISSNSKPRYTENSQVCSIM